LVHQKGFVFSFDSSYLSLLKNRYFVELAPEERQLFVNDFHLVVFDYSLLELSCGFHVSVPNSAHSAGKTDMSKLLA
jgi:hypothetical protein